MPGAAGTALLAGVLGWLLAAAALAALIMAVGSQHRRANRIQATLEPAIQAMQANVEPRREELAQERERLAKAINDLIRRQEDLTLRIKGLELVIREAEPQAVTLERTRSKLAEEVAALKEKQDAADQGIGALNAELAELARAAERLKEEYRVRFTAMRALYDQRKDDPDPDRMRQFYTAHRHTVFAPAAAYYAAEKLYAARRSADALRLYKELVRLYPGSAYVAAAQNRIAQIDAGGRYSDPPGAIEFEPYLPHAVATP